MKLSILLLLSAVCALALAASGLSSADPDEDEGQFTVGDFTYMILGPADASLVKYTEPSENPPEKVVIPETVTYGSVTYWVLAIEDFSFDSGMGEATKSVFIPKSVVSISPWAFESDYLEYLEVDSASNYFWSEDGVLFEKHSGTLLRYPPAKTSSEYDIGADVVIIGRESFSNSAYLQSVIIGGNVIIIDYDAFFRCKALTDVNFSGEHLKIVEDSAFESCPNLGSVYLPEGTTTIGPSAFMSCRSLSSVHIPSTVNNIGQMAFAECDSLVRFDLSDQNERYAISGDALYEKDANGRYTDLVAYPLGCDATETTIEVVDYISPYAFSGSKLTKITIPYGVTVLSSFALAEMKFLEEVDLPESIVKIDILAFMSCTSLEHIDIGGNVQIIGYGAFSQCEKLREVTLGEGIVEIADSAFSFTAIESLILPVSLERLGSGVFWGCESLSYVQIDSPSVEATDSFAMGEVTQEVTVRCYRGALKDLGDVNGNVFFEYYGERPFPLINLVGIAVCAFILLGILNYLRRI